MRKHWLSITLASYLLVWFCTDKYRLHFFNEKSHAIEKWAFAGKSRYTVKGMHRRCSLAHEVLHRVLVHLQSVHKVLRIPPHPQSVALPAVPMTWLQVA